MCYLASTRLPDAVMLSRPQEACQLLTPDYVHVYVPLLAGVFQ